MKKELKKPLPTPPPEEVVKANQEIEEVLKKYNLILIPRIEFPQYNILPDSVQLSLKVLEEHKPKFGIVLQPKA